ncbi:MAG TPA: bifunctional proline dehydrogenase/L-glutamate gamma-semialdehyde dehydrogenase [Frankiaceae bacterium]|nr:bifunctional proline dehydrogenase/L-glutamate gamma-semialdehyde dehydrogenase [Frankiaceae bacterium]
MDAPIGPPDGVGDALTAEAAALVTEWLHSAEASLSRRQRRERRRFQILTGDPRSLAFTMAFCDRVLRPESDAVAAAQLRAVAEGPTPPFLGAADRVLLRAGVRLAGAIPAVVMPATRRRLRQIVGALVVDRSDPAFARHLRRLRGEGFAVNVNLLGEYVLGEQEATRRLAAIGELLRRPDVDYVSVKASAVASQLNLWGYEHTLQRVMTALRTLFHAAADAPGGAMFLNLDMEEYADLRLTVDAFTRLLDEPKLRHLDAGIVLQAYLPDSFDVLREIVEWASAREGAGTVKVRIVKGANLAMESVEAAMHGWQRAPYDTKTDTDANFARMLDWVLDADRLSRLRIGIASHNLFDVAWGHLLASARGVGKRVEFEMLQGMARGIDAAVRTATGGLRLYTPVVAAADFDTALAYLFRRLEENSRGENFLRSSFDLSSDAGAFAAEQRRFEQSIAARWQVSSQPRRRQPLERLPGFHNTPDTDPTDTSARNAIRKALTQWTPTPLPEPVVDTAGIDRVVEQASAARDDWLTTTPQQRQALLRSVARQLAGTRPDLMAVMAHEACKTVAEGDGEVCEAIDMAAYYAEQIPGLGGAFEAEAGFAPLGVVLVTPPWNFPLAIPAGGVLAALAAGNAVVLKAPPQTPQCAYAIAEAVWSACRENAVDIDVLQYVQCPEEVIGEHLVAHPGIDAIVLTGARETADLFHRLAPQTPLFAETSGKNSIIVMPDADLDLAAGDVVHSAFGHAGQKCSAASLAICVGDVYTSARFRRQLIDAAASLVIGSATEPATTLAPLIGAPGPSLQRALTRLDPGERWLLEPRLVDAHANLWSPGIKEGVRPGSWFHQTECFGPVLGLMHAADLDEALAIANDTPFGLTGGIHTLDPATAARWLEGAEVGNAYVNRVITGAVVQRQPFGGWKGSVVGPGAKAGGPHYVAQLGRWHEHGLPERSAEPLPAMASWLTSAGHALEASERDWLAAAVRSDAWWQSSYFGIDHDPTGLFCESNVLRFRPRRRVVLWISPDARPAHVLRAYAAAAAAGCDLECVAATDSTLEVPGIEVGTASAQQLTERLLGAPPDALRVLGTRPPEFAALAHECFVDDAIPLADGVIEGLRYRREQAVSRTLHRFGNVVAVAPAQTP